MKLLTCAWIAKLQIHSSVSCIRSIRMHGFYNIFYMYMVPSNTCSNSYDAIEYEQVSFESPVNLVVTKQYLNFHLRSLFITFSWDKLTLFVHQLIDLHNKRSCDDVGNTNKLSFVWQCQIEYINSIIDGHRPSAEDTSSSIT